MNRRLFRPSSRARSVAAAALVITALTPLLASCTGDDIKGKPGAAGVGDPLFPKLGNGGFDVRHYDLGLDYEVRGGRLDATALLTAKAKQNLSAFNLDLRGLKVRGVSVDGEDAEFSRKGDQLTVRPSKVVPKGDEFRTKVTYGGKPKRMTDADDSVEGWVRTDDGAVVTGEPAGAMTWFPGSNHPGDKATYDIRITVPKGYTAVSNGELVGERTAKGRTTYDWHSGEPMASYLTTATIGKFNVSRYTTESGLPVYVAVDPREAKSSAKSLGKLEEMLDWETKLFGPYPFSSTGAIVDHGAGGVDYALEIQTKPFFPDEIDDVTLLHEMSHQWFGDSVTPKSWRDTWLNEGFATYAEWLWDEQHDGKSAQDRFDAAYGTGKGADKNGDDEETWEFPPGDPGKAANITGTPVYTRGAMVLHQLRLAVGDDTFFKILKDWPAEYRHGNANSADFIGFCERRTDEDLTELFDDWLYGKGRPAGY
ncbi:M1 family metallopeptidase [Streptomyces sp. H27-D2]|uniref:M1 family metallopeptidase n=1 Tax=Streptomyces sp. H27-D2 TaxID=3046304 RepID=UPI002DB688E1|nr:M1 family metallopeptidase [Streptomyces sp. H27-D2]MEC4016847.1 M1 family metallopeptidase [Streptomyces sp. H27-D2]